MCIIMACHEVVPDFRTLMAGEDRNQDGGGVAWINDEGLVEWRKGLTAAAINFLIQKRGIKPPMVVHFRVATVGGTVEELCHPFPVTPAAETVLAGAINGEVLFHNGHVGNWQGIGNHFKVALAGRISDSRVIAAATAISGSHNLVRAVSSDVQGYGNRFAILSSSGIKTYGQWFSYEKILFSNTGICLV